MSTHALCGGGKVMLGLRMGLLHSGRIAVSGRKWLWRNKLTPTPTIISTAKIQETSSAKDSKSCAIFDCISASRCQGLLYLEQPQVRTPGEHTTRLAIPQPPGLCPLMFASSTSVPVALSRLDACRPQC